MLKSYLSLDAYKTLHVSFNVKLLGLTSQAVLKFIVSISLNSAEMKQSFVIVYQLITITVCTIGVGASAKLESIGEKEYEGRIVRSIDSILDTLVSLESPSSHQSQSQTANTNSRAYNVPHPRGPHDLNQRQSSLFTGDKNSKGSRTSFSSQYDKRPSERPSSKLTQGHRRLDHNFPMIPFPYPPPFGAFPGMEENENSKQSFPQSDRSSYRSKDGHGNNNVKDTNDEFYGDAYPNTKYSMLPKRAQIPRHHKDHEILKASGYPSSKIFYPSHGIPSLKEIKEISIPMFSYGHERGYGYNGLPSRDVNGNEHKPKHTSSHRGLDDARHIENSLELRRENQGNQEDHSNGQLKHTPYGERLFSHGEHMGHRYGDGEATLGTNSGHRHGNGEAVLGDNPGHRYGDGISALRENSGYRFGEGQFRIGDNPDNRYGEIRSVYRDNPGHRYGDGQSVHEDNKGTRYEEGEFTHGDQPGNKGLSTPDEIYTDRQLTNAALGNLGLGPSIYEGYGDDKPSKSGHGSLGSDLSAYEGYGVGVGAFAGGQPLGPAYPATITNTIWRGYGQNHFGNGDKTQLTSVNAAALQALDGITSLNRDASHSSYSGIGGLGLASSYNQYKDLTGYGGLFTK